MLLYDIIQFMQSLHFIHIWKVVAYLCVCGAGVCDEHVPWPGSLMTDEVSSQLDKSPGSYTSQSTLSRARTTRGSTHPPASSVRTSWKTRSSTLGPVQPPSAHSPSTAVTRSTWHLFECAYLTVYVFISLKHGCVRLFPPSV